MSRVYYDIINITDITKINDIVQIFKEEIYIQCKSEHINYNMGIAR